METQSLEIYVRPSAERVLLNFYVPAGAKEAFLQALQQGTLESSTLPIALELSLLPEWATDPEARSKMTQELGSIHARIPVASLNVIFGD